ncbi:MAG: BMP family ABC transporter substrate-binding protein [Zestosphaera sp.]
MHCCSKGISKTFALVIIVLLIVIGASIWLLIPQLTPTPTTTPTTPKPTTPTTPATTPPKLTKICIVYDVGGRGDLSFNDMAYLGGDRAAKEFGLVLTELQSRSEADYLPNLRTLARAGDCLLIVGVGFLLTNAVSQVSSEYPNQLFAIIDGVVENRSNVLSVLFKEHEGSAVVGALAAMLAAHYNRTTVGVVLGMEIPVLYKFEAGYYWGIRYGEQIYKQKTGKDVNVKILYTYTGSFNDPGKGKTATDAMLGEGAVVVYNVAGATGLGIFEAVAEAGSRAGRTTGPPFAIGVDADQDYIKPGFIIASMMKRVDVGVYTAAKKALNYLVHKNVTKYGGILELGIAEGGIAMSRVEDLETFLTLGIQAGTVKAEDKDKILNAVNSMRNSVPSWIWEEAYKLQETLKTNKSLATRGVKFSDIESKIPFTAESIAEVRKALGVT